MVQHSTSFLIYGANGYTGRLIAREALRRGMHPVLAGRNAAGIEALGKELGLEARVFDCRDGDVMARELIKAGTSTVLHCAGPFSATSKPMLQACLQARCNYLDITGEIPVFERVLSRPELYRQAGIVAIPGVGFDVAPTDCVAALVKEQLPDARSLTLALKIAGDPSPGSYKTFAEGLHAGAFIREDGKLVRVPAASRTRVIPFVTGPARAVRAPWADVSTAWYSTGIPNIETYISIKPAVVLAAQASRFLAPILRLRKVQALVAGLIDWTVKGPGVESRGKDFYEIWAEGKNSAGAVRQVHVRTPNGYDVTVDASLKAVRKVLSGEVAPGAYAPSSAFGSGFLRELDGVVML